MTVTGAADAPFGDLAAGLGALTDGYECRAVVFRLESRGTAAAPARDDLLWMERYPVPLIASIEGDLSGAGGVLAIGCDIRVAAPSAVLTAGGVGSRRMLRLLGEKRSVAVLERGGRLDGRAAFEIGLVTAVSDDPYGEALRLARVIASRGPIATRFAKEAAWRGLELPLEQALRFETDLTVLLQSTKDRAEGVRAFLEKRAAAFTGD